MSADVVVIGAGVIGASIAAHLAQEGMRVTLIDRAAAPGAGSTGRATGGFRAQFGTAINVQLSLLSREKLRRFHSETGVDPGFREVGYLWLASELDGLREANALQQREGLTEARIVDRDEIARINPHVSLDGIAGGAWCPTDGVMRPLEILRGYLELATRLGVEVMWNERPRGITPGLVETESARIATKIVVNAAGPWAAEVARLAGVDIPVVPSKRMVAITEPTNALPADFPMTIWLSDGFHLRVRDDRVLLLRHAEESEFIDGIERAKRERVPPLANVKLDLEAGWSGHYEMSPDHHALIGRAPGCEWMLLANGSSGHGVMHAPAIGQLVAEIASGRPTAIDIRALRPSRFAENDPVRGSSLL